MFQSYNLNNADYLVLCGGLKQDFITKSKAVRIINLASPPKLADLDDLDDNKEDFKGDYFYDNQVLDLENELIVAGYVHTWKMMKECGTFTLHQKKDGLGY